MTSTINYCAMGKRIKELRKQHGFTQEKLAKEVGISTSFMGHVERGSRIPSLETLANLSKILQASLDAIVLGLDGGHAVSAHLTSRMRMLNDIMRVLNEHSDEWLRNI